MKHTTPNKLYTDKYLKLLEAFTAYFNIYKSNLDLPRNANIIIFDSTDSEFSTNSLKKLNYLIKKKDTNIVEVTKTGSRSIPWRISKTYLSQI